VDDVRSALRLRALLPAILLLSFLMSPVAANHVDPFEVIKVLEVDDIPAIYRPRFTQEDYLEPDEEVIGLALGGEARAYPIRIMNWHEVVNDVVGGEPVAVTYCPLCGSGIVFGRVVKEAQLTLGVSGMLYKSNLVMVDNETGSLWSQMTGEAILGPMHGERLRWLPSFTLPWAEWRVLHPDTLILLPPLPQCEGGRTGMGCRDYMMDPYEGYRLSTVVYSDFGAEYTDTILHPKTAVLGLEVGGVAMAYPLFALEETPVVHDVLNRQRVLITYVNGSAQAFDPGERSFVPADEGGMLDQDGVRWSRLTGESAKGARLDRLQDMRAMWFAWTGFHPGTGVYGMRSPSVLTFAILSDPVDVSPGQVLHQVVHLNNTADFAIVDLSVHVRLSSILEYMDDSADSLPSFVRRSAEGEVMSFSFSALPPGLHTFDITARVREGDHPGIVFRSSVSIQYQDPDGRTITASRDGDTFRLVEGRAEASLLPLLPLAAAPLLIWWLLWRRRGSGNG
jgi:hypothetical protein